MALGNEPIRIGEQIVGRVTSGGYGYTVGASIAYGYLPAGQAEVDQRVEVEIFGEWVGWIGQGRAAVRPEAEIGSGPDLLGSRAADGRVWREPPRRTRPTAARTRGR